MIVIRKLTPDDIPQLRDLAIRIYRDTFSHQNSAENMEAFLANDYSIEKFQSEFDDPTSSYFFACDGNVPTGYLRLRYNPEAEEYLGKNTIELHRIYVDVQYQGQRIGQQL